MSIDGSPLYERVMACADRDEDRERAALSRKVWNGTPWMLNVNGGSPGGDQTREIILWCREHFGDEAWPIHSEAGNWQRGSATVYGWTWYGFATEQMMQKFQAKWGGTTDEE